MSNEYLTIPLFLLNLRHLILNIMNAIKEFFYSARRHQLIIWLGVLLITIFVIYTPEFLFFKKLSSRGIQVMFGLLVLAISFAFLNDSRTMWVSLACSGVLCLHLRTREPFYPNRSGVSFKVAHIDIENSTDYEKTIDAILENDPDVISFQNLNPDWDFALKEFLGQNYPYERTFISLDVYNPAVYSKYPFSKIDTFNYKDAPNIYGSFQIEEREISFFSSITVPPVDIKAYNDINKHLQILADSVKKTSNPVVAIGDYSVVTHSRELSTLREEAGLKDSRTSHTFMGESPLEHILYSKQLECTSFVSISESGQRQIGIMGTYQFKNNGLPENKTARSKTKK